MIYGQFYGERRFVENYLRGDVRFSINYFAWKWTLISTNKSLAANFRGKNAR